jgi:hypothetical protein
MSKETKKHKTVSTKKPKTVTTKQVETVETKQVEKKITNKVTSRKDFKFEVNGIIIQSDTLYEVIPKPDYDAPDGYQEYGTTKLLHPQVSNKVCCVYNSAAQVWDTGFYESSPCYRNVNPEIAREKVSVLRERIVEPIERLLGKGRLDHTSMNNDYWDNYNPEIKKGTVLNSSVPNELLTLYMISRHNFVAPKDNSSNPQYRKAQYCIVNKAEVTNVKQERKFNLSRATSQGFSLMKDNREKLDYILNYLGISSATINDEMTLNSVLTNYLEDKKHSTQNVKSFLEAVDKCSTNNGYMEIYLYSVVKKLHKRKYITKEGLDYYFKDTNLGKTYKTAAKLALLNKSLQTELIEKAEV